MAIKFENLKIQHQETVYNKTVITLIEETGLINNVVFPLPPLKIIIEIPIGHSASVLPEEFRALINNYIDITLNKVT
jgi:hypothetical protein